MITWEMTSKAWEFKRIGESVSGLLCEWDVTSYSSQCPDLAREWAWRDFGVVRLLQTEEGGHWGLCTACCHPAERSFVLTRPQCPSQAPPPFLVRYLCCGQYAQSSLLCSWFCCWNPQDHRPRARTGARKSLLRDSILCSKDEPISFCSVLGQKWQLFAHFDANIGNNSDL